MDENVYSRQLLGEFDRFVFQKEVGRPGRVQRAEGRPEALSVIARAVVTLNSNDVIYLANAVSFLSEIDQAYVFGQIAVPSEIGFMGVRRRIVIQLLATTPKDNLEFQKYVWLYGLLNTGQPGLIRRWYWRIRHGISSEQEYLLNLPIPEGTRYIKNKVTEAR